MRLFHEDLKDGGEWKSNAWPLKYLNFSVLQHPNDNILRFLNPIRPGGRRGEERGVLTSYWLVILWLFMFFFYKQIDKKSTQVHIFFKKYYHIYCNKCCIKYMIYVIICNKQLFFFVFQKFKFIIFFVYKGTVCFLHIYNKSWLIK